MINQTHEAEVLGGGNDVLRGHDGAVAAADAHETFIESDLARVRLDHRFECQQYALVIERADDLVAGALILPALLLALEIWTVGQERAAALGFGCVQRLVRAR